MKIRIAIADDHPLVVNGLYHILGNCPDMEITGSYTDGRELLKGIALSPPDVLLLDIQMPGQTGDELAGIISSQFPAVRMLALTNLDNVYYVRTMLRNGVKGYILKTSREETLLEAIRTIYNDGQYLETSLKEKIIQDTFQSKKRLSADPILSRREKEVLQLISANMTSQQIANELFLSKRTVDNHRLSIMMKLGVKNVAALVKAAIQQGLVG